MKIRKINNNLVIICERERKLEEILNIFKLNKYSYKHLRGNKEVFDENVFKNDELWFPILNCEFEFEAVLESVKVVYEDDFILIVDKPPFLLVHSDGVCKDNLNFRVNNYLGFKSYPLHRLDKDTSGLLIFVKYKSLIPYFDSLLVTRKIKRDYYAFVDGYFKVNQKIKIAKKIGRDRHRSGAFRISESGKEAVSYGVAIKSSFKNKLTLLKMSLDSGRTHQLRVHLASIKHAIVGDLLYNNIKKDIRLSLQAYSLEIDSMLHSDLIRVEIPLSEDLEKYFKDLIK